MEYCARGPCRCWPSSLGGECVPPHDADERLGSSADAIEAGAPVVRDGLISLAVELPLPDGGYRLIIESVSVADFSGIADGGKVTVCHLPPGKRDSPLSIRVGAPALGAHLAHGDRLGACP